MLRKYEFSKANLVTNNRMKTAKQAQCHGAGVKMPKKPVSGAAIGVICALVVLVPCKSEAKVMVVTAYDNAGPHGCSKCCGKWAKLNRTADGHIPKVGITCGVNGLPFGTKLMIEGVGLRIVQDRPVKRLEGLVDLFVGTHKEARCFGKRRLIVEVVK